MKKRKKRYQLKKQFIKTIKRQSLEKIIALTKEDYLSECIYVEPLKKGDKLFIESDDMSDSFLNRSKANNEIPSFLGYPTREGHKKAPCL